MGEKDKNRRRRPRGNRHKPTFADLIKPDRIDRRNPDDPFGIQAARQRADDARERLAEATARLDQARNYRDELVEYALGRRSEYPAPPPRERHGSNRRHQEKHWSRRRAKKIRRNTTALILAGSLSVSALAGGKVAYDYFQDPSHQPPTHEQMVYPAGSLEALVHELSINDSVKKQETITDLNPLIPYVKPTAYTTEIFFENGGMTQQRFPSAELYTIGYDTTTNTLRLTDRETRGTPDANIEYHIFQPLIANPILKAAYASGVVDDVQIRFFDETQPYHNGQYVIDNKTLYLFLPHTLDTITYSEIISHEVLHSFTNQSALSNLNEANFTPEEFTSWQNACGDIRTIAMNQIGQQSQGMVTLMDQYRDMFTDPAFSNPAYKQVYEDIYSALQRGDFNSLQPVANAFDGKVPNCNTLGPNQVFFMLLNDRGITHIEPLTDKENEFLFYIEQEWLKTLAYKTIYNELREGPYNVLAGGTQDSGGHPYENWDEMVTSINNLIITHPEAFTETINKLSPEQKEAAMQLVSVAVETLEGLIPETEATEPLRSILQTNYDTWQTQIT